MRRHLAPDLTRRDLLGWRVERLTTAGFETAVAERIAAEADIDVDRFREDYAAGAGREAVIADYRAAVEHGVRSIPTVVIPETGRCLVGLAELSQYRAAVDEAARAAS